MLRVASALPLALAAFLAALSSSPSPMVSAGVLTDWTYGIATHYGGAQEGMNPNNPSYGTKEGREFFLFFFELSFFPLKKKEKRRKNPNQINNKK